jgi:predicted PurR-regulated permease PerM
MANASAPNGAPQPASPRRPEQAIGWIVIVLLLIGSFIILRPFLSALLWAIVLSFSIWPVHRRLVAGLRGQRTLAALLITLIFLAAIVVPLVVTVANLARDARALTAAGREWLRAGPPPSPAWVARLPLIGPPASRYWNDVCGDLTELARQLDSVAEEAPSDPTLAIVTAPATTSPVDTTGPATAPTTAPARDRSALRQTVRVVLAWARSFLITFGLAIGAGVTHLVLSLLLMFFILKDGEALAERLSSMAARISQERGTQLLDVAGATVRGVVYGILGTALAQGIMAGIGFLIAGVPGATLLGLLTFFLSVVPMGPPLVWIPVALWLFHQGRPGWGVFMLIWGVGVSSIDNVVKPLIISRGSNMPFVLIFFGVLGGALTFGLIGVFIGPTLLAVAYRLIEEWSRGRAG